MDKAAFEKAKEEGKVFKIGDSFIFVAQVPDNMVGISGSRCSNCGDAVAYCNQICEQCWLPFVGPSGFPQLPEWEALSLDEKRVLVEKVYCSSDNRGRLGYANVVDVPLTPSELDEIEKLGRHETELFISTHEISPENIRNFF